MGKKNRDADNGEKNGDMKDCAGFKIQEKKEEVEERTPLLPFDLWPFYAFVSVPCLPRKKWILEFFLGGPWRFPFVPSPWLGEIFGAYRTGWENVPGIEIGQTNPVVDKNSNTSWDDNFFSFQVSQTSELRRRFGFSSGLLPFATAGQGQTNNLLLSLL